MKVGLILGGDTAEEEFEGHLTEQERKCLEDPYLDIEVMYYELFHPQYGKFFSGKKPLPVPWFHTNAWKLQVPHDGDIFLAFPTYP